MAPFARPRSSWTPKPLQSNRRDNRKPSIAGLFLSGDETVFCFGQADQIDLAAFQSKKRTASYKAVRLILITGGTKG
jgi:hypothetical protein